MASLFRGMEEEFTTVLQKRMWVMTIEHTVACGVVPQHNYFVSSNTTMIL